MDILTILFECIFIIPILFIFVYMELLTRERIILYSEIEYLVLTKFSSKTNTSIESILEECNISKRYYKQSKSIIIALADKFSDGINKLCPNDSFGELFKVQKIDIKGQYKYIWTGDKLGEILYSSKHGDYLLEIFHRNIHSCDLYKFGNDEDELLNYIESISICELLHTFSPLWRCTN